MQQQKATNLFAEIILPLPLPIQYTYSIPEGFQEYVVPGMRVLVQFGKKKFYSAIVLKIHDKKPSSYKPKPITSVLDEEAVVNPIQLQFWLWMADYYLCHLGDIMNAALPSGLKLESETIIILHPAFEGDFSALDNKEYLVAEALTMRHELSLNEIKEILDLKTVYPVIKSMMDKRVILPKEELLPGYKPKIEEYIQMGDKYKGHDSRKQLFDSLEKAPRQLEMVLQFYQLKGKRTSIPKKELLDIVGKNYSALNALISKGVFDVSSHTVSRIKADNEIPGDNPVLTDAQNEALEKINESLKTKQVVLLHGVTSSGKTEIYANMISNIIAGGKQVLYLLPEIALTGQMINRLKKIFGPKIGIYHSRFSEMERVEIWKKVINREYQIVLGARSALFLPFSNLGFVVVDEEHDNSFKQYDPAPRYNARDAAIYLAGLHGAKVILGSATPAIESFFNALRGKYGLVGLTTRYGDIMLPEIKVVDTNRSQRISFKGAFLSDTLADDLSRILKDNKQAILFRNRRGYAPMVICKTCSHVPHCDNCDVSLTYHKWSGDLKCHYCGHKRKLITKCPACGSANIQVQGFGTEKVEDELNNLFPKIKTARLDYDTVRTKQGHNKIISRFENREVDVLVGTQMVTKGLDFDNVALVGVLMADQLWNYPDFRSFERAFQLMVQVSGRAGRKNKQGEVLIQARDINHSLINLVKSNNYEAFYHTELVQRRKFRYPPYTRLIILHFKHRQVDMVYKAANHLYKNLHPKLGKRIFPPNAPPVARIRNQYLANMMIKMERDPALIKEIKELVRDQIVSLGAIPELRQVQVFADVDPQ